MSIFEHINKKVALIFGGVLVILLGAFFYWLAGTEGSTSGSVTVLNASPLDATLGGDLLAALAKLQSTKLDTSIFSDPVFASLKDFGVEIAAQPVGRRNPFAVFSGSASAGRTGAGPIKATLPSGTGKKTDTATSTINVPANPGGFDVE